MQIDNAMICAILGDDKLAYVELSEGLHCFFSQGVVLNSLRVITHYIFRFEIGDVLCV